MTWKSPAAANKGWRKSKSGGLGISRRCTQKCCDREIGVLKVTVKMLVNSDEAEFYEEILEHKRRTTDEVHILHT